MTWKQLTERDCREWKWIWCEICHACSKPGTWKGAHCCGYCRCNCMLIKNLMILMTQGPKVIPQKYFPIDYSAVTHIHERIDSGTFPGTIIKQLLRLERETIISIYFFQTQVLSIHFQDTACRTKHKLRKQLTSTNINGNVTKNPNIEFKVMMFLKRENIYNEQYILPELFI